MREYEHSLADRLRRAENEKRRYWTNPKVRLATINRVRAYQGREPRTSLDEVRPHRRQEQEA